MQYTRHTLSAYLNSISNQFGVKTILHKKNDDITGEYISKRKKILINVKHNFSNYCFINIFFHELAHALLTAKEFSNLSKGRLSKDDSKLAVEVVCEEVARLLKKYDRIYNVYYFYVYGEYRYNKAKKKYRKIILTIFYIIKKAIEKLTEKRLYVSF